MIVTQRSSQQAPSPRTARSPRSPTHISYPISTEQSLSQTTTTSSTSPPKTPTRGRRPSVSNPMTWLSRSSTSGSTQSAPYAAAKPIRISEPKFKNSFEILNSQRSGPLGTGATVVRTPQEALTGSRVQLTSGGNAEDEERDSEQELIQEDDIMEFPSPPESPPLPPVPLSQSSPDLPIRMASPPARPTRPPPPAPTVCHTATNLRPSLKSRSPPASEYSPPVPSVPSLPSNITSSPPQPPFEPILVSPVPISAIDFSKIIVSLETSTSTHRTTLSTLMSRPSYLSSYLESLLPRSDRDSDTASVHSHTSSVLCTPDTAFNSIFHQHLTASGFLPQSSSSIHIFLDRPSAPYAHILTYLRSPPSSPEAPAVLPRAVQLTSTSTSRLEALLELRDEARYLDLDELYKLCTDEIGQRHGLGLHSRGYSSGSGASVRSTTTFREKLEQEQRYGAHDSCDAKSIRTGGANEMGVRSPAPPQYTASRGRSHSRFSSVRSPPPPAGWI